MALVKTKPLCLYSVTIQSKGWQFSGGQRFYRLRGLKVNCDVRFNDVVSGVLRNQIECHNIENRGSYLWVQEVNSINRAVDQSV